jgi:hypothetical protein
MPEPNPMAVIADCIEKSKATTDQELIGDCVAEALGVLQIDNTEDDAFAMLGSAIADGSRMTKRIPLPCSRSGSSWRSSANCNRRFGTPGRT